MFLVIVDAHSKWLDVHLMKSITSARTIEKLRILFVNHGIPQKTVSDNGPSFRSDEFKMFMQANGILHVTSALYDTSTNGVRRDSFKINSPGSSSNTGSPHTLLQEWQHQSF